MFQTDDITWITIVLTSLGLILLIPGLLIHRFSVNRLRIKESAILTLLAIPFSWFLLWTGGVPLGFVLGMTRVSSSPNYLVWFALGIAGTSFSVLAIHRWLRNSTPRYVQRAQFFIIVAAITIISSGIGFGINFALSITTVTCCNY